MPRGTMPSFGSFNVDGQMVALQQGHHEEDGYVMARWDDTRKIIHVGREKGWYALPAHHRKRGVFPIGICRGLDREGMLAVLAMVPREEPHIRGIRWIEGFLDQLGMPACLASPGSQAPDNFTPSRSGPPARRDSQEMASPFDVIRHEDEDGEYWLAREMLPLLEYGSWQKFEVAVGRAMDSCRTKGFDPADHFIQVDKMVQVGSGASRSVRDIRLTRYACSLITMNGDPTKPQVAAGQAYFYIMARQSELAGADQRPANHEIGAPAIESMLRAIVAPFLQQITSEIRAAQQAPAIEFDQGFRVLNDVPPGYYRFTQWRDLRGLPRDMIDQKYEINQILGYASRMESPVYRIKPPNDPRPRAFYFHETVLRYWDKVWTQKHPVWTTKSLPFAGTNRHANNGSTSNTGSKVN